MENKTSPKNPDPTVAVNLQGDNPIKPKVPVVDTAGAQRVEKLGKKGVEYDKK